MSTLSTWCVLKHSWKGIRALLIQWPISATKPLVFSCYIASSPRSKIWMALCGNLCSPGMVSPCNLSRLRYLRWQQNDIEYSLASESHLFRHLLINSLKGLINHCCWWISHCPPLGATSERWTRVIRTSLQFSQIAWSCHWNWTLQWCGRTSRSCEKPPPEGCQDKPFWSVLVVSLRTACCATNISIQHKCRCQQLTGGFKLEVWWLGTLG